MAAEARSQSPAGIGRISPWLSFPLTILLVAFALSLFVKDRIGSHAEIMPMLNSSAPIFITWRQPETGLFFAIDRIKDARLFYGYGHAVPAIVWASLIPVQLSDRIRRSYPRVHRASGYTVFAASLVIAITGPLMAPKGLSYTHPEFWHFHSAGSKGNLIPQWIRWPSFEFSTTVVEAAFVLTGVQALRKAVARKYAQHRRWATHFAVSGYVIGLQRVNMLVVNLFGALLTRLPRDSKLARDLGIPTDLREIAEAERAAFALTAVCAGLMGFAWSYNVEHQRPVVRAKTA